MLRPRTSEPTFARLTLAIGSRAGIEAPLQIGYYMIGRHQECQIRPKSRSVSRRHCLIENSADRLRVIDLNSTTGTTVNDQRLNPKEWTDLSDGDMLRCGKVLFHVSTGDRSSCEDSPANVAEKSSGGGEAMNVGQAWQDVDVAGFLESEDDVARERRYDNIRSEHAALADAESTDAECEASERDTSGDLGEFEEAFDEPFDTTPAASDDQGAAPQVSPSAPKPKRAKSAPPPPKISPRKRFQGFPKLTFSAWFSLRGSEQNQWKLKGAIIMAVVILGFAGMKAYQLYQGPEVRVIENID